MLKKMILALAVMGLFGTAVGTASAHGWGRGCYGPGFARGYVGYYGGHYPPPVYGAVARPYYGGFYRGPSSYFAPGSYYGGYPYGGYGTGWGITTSLGF